MKVSEKELLEMRKKHAVRVEKEEQERRKAENVSLPPGRLTNFRI